VGAPGLHPRGAPLAGGLPIMGGPPHFIPGPPDFYAQQAAAQQFGGGIAPIPGGFGGHSPANYNSVLLVSNLNEEKTSCATLFNLFSCYGNVLRVKILHNKPDHALIQLGDYYQASTALHYLKGLVLFDKQLDVNFSKHAYINASPQDASDPSCADYTSSPLNRFKITQGGNPEKAQQIYKNMSGPVNLLHISNVPATATNQLITDLFAPFGTVTGVKVFDISGKKQALVQFDSVQHSAEALITLHNTQVEGRGLKISFSKNKL